MRYLTTVSLMLLGGLVAACADGVLIGPDNQLEVTSAVDQFQFQLTALEGVTDTRSYDWENTGTQATIDVSQSITGGSALITIRDASGATLYSSDAADDNDTTTDAGQPGTWSVTIELVAVSGAFNFRAQKTT